MVGKFFGLPLEVRHVTLSTGALALAACARGTRRASASPAFRSRAVLGILVIFVMNLSVSFVLALAVALRAREVARRDRWRLWASVFVTFARSPPNSSSLRAPPPSRSTAPSPPRPPAVH